MKIILFHKSKQLEDYYLNTGKLEKFIDTKWRTVDEQERLQLTKTDGQVNMLVHFVPFFIFSSLLHSLLEIKGVVSGSIKDTALHVSRLIKNGFSRSLAKHEGFSPGIFSGFLQVLWFFSRAPENQTI